MELDINTNLLLYIATAFFAILAEWRRDALYWLFCFLASLYLLINRPDASIIPIPIFVGWLFVVLYQLMGILATGKAENLGGTGEE